MESETDAKHALLTFAEAQVLRDVLRQLDMEIAKRRRGLSQTHEYGRVRFALSTDDGETFMRLLLRSFAAEV